MTGGRLWTFSNGMTVVYKKLDTKGTFNYGVLLRGGYYDVPGLQEGEGIFVSDMFKLTRIGDRSWDEFRMMLETAGISMDVEVNASDMRVFGKAPSSEAGMLFSSILALSEVRTMDDSLFGPFVIREKYRRGMEAMYPRDVNSLIDSLICPSFSSRRMSRE